MKSSYSIREGTVMGSPEATGAGVGDALLRDLSAHRWARLQRQRSQLTASHCQRLNLSASFA